MSEPTLFAADPVAPTADPITDPVIAPAPTPTLTIPAEVADLIGNGKKYATVEAALASLPHAQTHISTLEAENSEYKAKLMSNDKLDLVLQKLDTPTPEPVALTEPTPGISREDLSTLVQQEMAKSTKVNQEEANLGSVESKLRETYGETVGSVFNAKATEIGMTPAQLTALAKVAPQAVLSLVGITKPGAVIPNPTGDGLNLATIGEQGEPHVKKNIMFGATSEEIKAEWNACAPEQ